MRIKTNTIVFSLFVLFICAFLPISGQNPIILDSLLNLLPAKDDTSACKIYAEIKDEYQFRDFEKYNEFLQKEIEAAKKSGHPKFLAAALFSEAVDLANNSEYADSERKFLEVEEYLKKEGNEVRIAKVYQILANISSMQGHYQLAIERAQFSLDLMDKLQMDSTEMIRGFMALGNIHGEIENYDLSDKYYNLVVDLYEKIDDDFGVFGGKMNLGINLLMQGKYEEAKLIFLELQALIEEDGNIDQKIAVLGNLGNVEQQLDNLEKGVEYYTEGLRLAEQSGIEGEIMIMNSRLGDIYIDLGREKEAIILLEKCNTQLKGTGNLDHQLNIYDLLRVAYKNDGNYKMAYQNLRDYTDLNDSIQSVDKLSTINELEVKYQTAKKETEILRLEAKTKQDSLIKKGMTFGILGLCLLFAAVYYALRQRLMKNKLIQKQIEQKLEYSNRELELKKQGLTAYALQLAHKNEILESIKLNVSDVIKKDTHGRELQNVVNTIKFNQNDDESWEGFRERFNAVHKDFDVKVKETFPKVSPNELRLMALLKMNLTSKEIANILNISSEGIKKARYRLRKKLGLNSADSLEELVLAI